MIIQRMVMSDEDIKAPEWDLHGPHSFGANAIRAQLRGEPRQVGLRELGIQQEEGQEVDGARMSLALGPWADLPQKTQSTSALALVPLRSHVIQHAFNV